MAQIAIAVQIIVSFVGIKAEHIGIVVGIHTEAVFLGVVPLKAAGRMVITICSHITAAFQYAAINAILTQSIDNIIKFCLERIAFQIGTVVIPR